MFRRHIAKQLSAYLHGELSAQESRRVAEHLLGCERCRREYDEIKLGAHLAEHLPLVTAPAEMWSEIEAMLDAASVRLARESIARRFFSGIRWYHLAAASAAVMLIVVVSVVWLRRPAIPRPEDQVKDAPPEGGKPLDCSWEVESLIGKVKIDGNLISGEGCFAVGELLETDNTSRAKIKIEDVGEVELEANSRVRLVVASETEQRLAMDRGTMHAIIDAPPRIFFVDMPSAEAIDLGCEYTLEVDDSGRGLLHVTYGQVMLVRDGRESYVPIGAMCQTRPGIGPGTPYFANSSNALQDALTKFDFENGGWDALRVVLQEARDKDTFTLWHLIQRVDIEQRSAVLKRMIVLVGLPKGVTRKGIMQLDQDMLDYWKDELDPIWFQ